MLDYESGKKSSGNKNNHEKDGDITRLMNYNTCFRSWDDVHETCLRPVLQEVYLDNNPIGFTKKNYDHRMVRFILLKSVW